MSLLRLCVFTQAQVCHRIWWIVSPVSEILKSQGWPVPPRPPHCGRLCRQQHSGWPSCGDADKMLTDIHNYSRTTMVFFITVPSPPSPPTPSPRTSHQRGSRFKHSSFTSHDWCGLDRTESQRNWLSRSRISAGWPQVDILSGPWSLWSVIFYPES